MAECGDEGAVLRPVGGTEPMARVMVGGPGTARVHAGAERIGEALRIELS